METQTQKRPENATGEIAIMGPNGDSKHYWDKGKPEEARIAYKVFKRYSKLGYRAFRMTEKGDQGEIMNEFDSSAGCILFVPPLAGG